VLEGLLAGEEGALKDGRVQLVPSAGQHPVKVDGHLPRARRALAGLDDDPSEIEQQPVGTAVQTHGTSLLERSGSTLERQGDETVTS